MQGLEARIQAIQVTVAAQEWAKARQMATLLVQEYPHEAHSWLWMAWLCEDAKASLGYAQRAATLDPTVGNPAIGWAERRLQENHPSPVADSASASLYSQKSKSKWGGKWGQVIALLATTGMVAMATILWRGGVGLPASITPIAGRYASLPINLDRPNDPTLNQVPPPESANRAITISAEATPTPILQSPTPTFAPTPTLVAEPEMIFNGGDAIPPPVVPTATTQPIDTRNLLFPVWPNRFEPVVYRVQAGDNLTTIAARTGLTPWTLIWSNDEQQGNPELLTIGQELWIPPLDGVLHVVKPGDTLEGLAALYKVDVGIIRWFEGNDLEGGGSLVAGQRLMVPGGVKPVEDLPPPPAAPTTRGGASYFGWPTTGVITQSYGSYHGGIDIANANKTPIFASQSGEVTYAGWDNSGYGYMIILDHHNGWRTRYAHLSGMYPAVGDWVNRGDLLALMGSTGNSTGPHLHFEIITKGYRFNPLNYLPR